MRHEFQLLCDLQDMWAERARKACAEVVGYANFVDFGISLQEDELIVYVITIPQPKPEVDAWCDRLADTFGLRHVQIEYMKGMPHFKEPYNHEEGEDGCAIRRCQEPGEEDTPLGLLCEEHLRIYQMRDEA